MRRLFSRPLVAFALLMLLIGSPLGHSASAQMFGPYWPCNDPSCTFGQGPTWAPGANTQTAILRLYDITSAYRNAFTQVNNSMTAQQNSINDLYGWRNNLLNGLTGAQNSINDLYNWRNILNNKDGDLQNQINAINARSVATNTAASGCGNCSSAATSGFSGSSGPSYQGTYVERGQTQVSATSSTDLSATPRNGF